MRIAYTSLFLLLFSFVLQCGGSGGGKGSGGGSGGGGGDDPVASYCGDNILDTGEICDDGNSTGNDGCGVTCLTENLLQADGVRVSGTLIAEGKVLFVLPVQVGEPYGIYWHDNFYGDGSQTAYALKVSAYSDNHNTNFFSQAYSGYSSPRTITPASGTFVNIIVEGYFSNVAGTFEIWVVRGFQDKTVVHNVTHSNYILSGGLHTYLFNNLVVGAPYFLSWNDRYDGDGSMNADIKVTAENGDSTFTYFTDVDAGYTLTQQVVPDSTAAIDTTVDLKYTTSPVGTYSITLSLYCGNGTLEPAYLEACDDGDNTNGDGCSSSCDTEGTLDLTSNNTTINVGMAEQFTAFFTDYLSNVTDETDTVVYYVSDSTIGYMSNQSGSLGMFIPLKAGSVDVYVTYGNEHTSNTITLSVEYPATAGDLFITEVNYGVYTSTFVEIINTGASPANLSQYKLRSIAYNWPTTTYSASTTFDLPDMTIPPGGYVRVASGIGTNTFQVSYLIDINEFQPYFPTSGFVELLKAGVTQDFVRWGTSTVNPTTAGHWDSSAAPALTTDASSSLGRDGANTDTNTTGDWTWSEYATPGGPNDVTCTTDTDTDGIPDCSELPGSTFAGLPLYDWGARQNQTDVFLEIDYMKPDEAGKVLRPIREALDAVVTVFAARGVVAHFDIGDVYDQSPGLDSADHDLGGGNEVPYSKHLTIGDHGDGITVNSRDYKYQYMDLRRLPIFHYVLIGDRSPPDFSFGGLGEMYGNDFIVTYGHHTQHLNYTSTYGWHGPVILHELGHNLGLGHGGDTSVNYKPNYFSVMNYMYGGPAVATGTVNEGYRYLRNNFFGDTDCYPAYDAALYNSSLDFSDGLMPSLDENNLNESNGLSGAGFWVDFNCDGNVNTSVSYNLNPSYDSTKDVLTDHDDWTAIDYRFRDHGAASSYHLNDYADLQKVASEAPAEVRRNSFIRRGKLKDRHSKKFPNKNYKK
ncbi:MAG: lamin tail domain-containing protein [Leptospirales bacterium]